MKTKVDKLDIDKLGPVPGNLSRLAREVKADFTKKRYFNTLKTKVDDIDVSKFVSKTKYEGKIPDISGLATKTKITALENKIPDISGLATKTNKTAVENKIPDVSGFV